MGPHFIPHVNRGEDQINQLNIIQSNNVGYIFNYFPGFKEFNHKAFLFCPISTLSYMPETSTVDVA